MTEYIKKEYVVNTLAIKKALGYYIKQGNEYNKIIKTSYSEEKETDTTTYTLKNDTEDLFNELRKDNELKSECKYKVRFFIGIEKCDVEECPYRKENGECAHEHSAVIYIEYDKDSKSYDATVFCEFNFYEDEKTRKEERKEILKENKRID